MLYGGYGFLNSVFNSKIFWGSVIPAPTFAQHLMNGLKGKRLHAYMHDMSCE